MFCVLSIAYHLAIFALGLYASLRYDRTLKAQAGVGAAELQGAPAASPSEVGVSAPPGEGSPPSPGRLAFAARLARLRSGPPGPPGFPRRAGRRAADPANLRSNVHELLAAAQHVALRHDIAW